MRHCGASGHTRDRKLVYFFAGKGWSASADSNVVCGGTLRVDIAADVVQRVDDCFFGKSVTATCRRNARKLGCWVRVAGKVGHQFVRHLQLEGVVEELVESTSGVLRRYSPGEISSAQGHI